MERPIEVIDLGDRFEFECAGRALRARCELCVYPGDVAFDGDDPEDVAAYGRGDFQMYVAEVVAHSAGGELSGSDILGGVAASKLEDITSCMEEHGMVAEVLRDLGRRVGAVLEYAGGVSGAK